MNVQSVYLIASDPDKLARFYRELLGASPTINVPDTWIQFRTGTVNFAISGAAEAAPGAVGGTIVFDVGDIEATVRLCEGLGATVVQRRDMGSHGKTASIRDPDGNIVQFLQKT